jgi:hypothetical protein
VPDRERVRERAREPRLPLSGSRHPSCGRARGRRPAPTARSAT